MVTPMTAIPVLFHREIESQTVEFQSMGLGMCVLGRIDILISSYQITCLGFRHLPQNIVPRKSAQQRRHVDCVRLCTPNGNPMTAIPVLLHYEVESQDRKIRSVGLDMCVCGDSVDYGM